MSIERELLKNWTETTYQEPEVQLAAGPAATVTDTGPAFNMPGMGKRSQKSEVGQNLPIVAADMAAGGAKGLVSGVAGFAGDIESLYQGVKGLITRGGDEGALDAFLKGMAQQTIAPTSEDVSKWLDANVGPVVPKDSGMSPEMQKARETAAGAGEFVGQLAADPTVAIKGAKAVAKGAKALAPKAAEMIINATEKTGVPVKGLGITEKAPSFDGVEPVKTFKTADGFTLYELKNGSIVDNLDPERVDMSWDNFAQLKDDFGDDVYQVGDQLGERKAMVSSFGTANPDQMMDKYNAFQATPEPDQLYQQALNKQNNPPSNVVSMEAPKMVVSDFTETLFKAKTKQDGESIRFKNPLTLKDGSRLSGFTNPKKQNVFFGYDKNGELFTVGREYVNPEDIVSSRDSNKTATQVKKGLEHLDEYKAKMSTSQQEPK